MKKEGVRQNPKTKSEHPTKRCDDFPFLSKDPLQRYEDTFELEDTNS